MAIRTAKIEDYREIQKLFQEVQDIHSKARSDVYKKNKIFKMDEFKEMLTSENNYIFVYEDNKRIIGLCSCIIKNQNPNNTIYGKKYLYIDTIVVENSSTKHGIGKKLYLYVRSVAIQHRCKSVELNVWNFNKNAIEFYKKMNMEVKSIKFEEKL